MFDTVTAARLPADAELVAAYVDGTYANEAEVRARCPQATVVTITTRPPGHPGANVADVETYDFTPEQGAAWAARELAAGRQPTLYCNRSTWPAVRYQVRAHGVAGRVSYWIAHYDGRAELIPGAVAKQYLERHDQNLDYGIAADFWPGVDPAPVPPQPTAKEPEDMTIVYAPGRATCLLAAGRLWPLQSNAEKDAYVEAGVEVHAVSAAHFDLIDGVSKRIG